jgi:DMSO/TMAO reductase YedYZ molybdopterin-dependent catalytic subunit
MKTVDSSNRGLGAVVGLLTAAVAVGIAEFVAGFTGETTWPVVAVGQVAINFTPPALKDFAVSSFGNNDKLVLLTGIGAIMALCAAIVGRLALRELRYGMAGLAAFAVIGVWASVTRPNATAVAALPTLAGVVAGAGAMFLLVRAALSRRPPPPAVSRPRSPGLGGSAPGGLPPAGSRSGLGTFGDPGAFRDPSTPPEPGPPPDPYGAGRGYTRPRPTPPPPGPRRRSLLLTGATMAGAAAVAGLAGRSLAERNNVTEAQRAFRVPRPASPAPPLPAGADLKIPGLSSFITPNNSFYRVDTALVLPEVAPSTWSLRVHGMVRKEIHLSFSELLRRPLTEEYITLTCVSNPVAGPYVGNAKWLGASLRSLLRQAGVKPGANQLLCTSADGFTAGTPLVTTMDGRDAMLAIAMNGTALPVAHGFPVRMVVPGLYGYVSACKWITDIEVTTFEANTAYWVQRGWSQQAPIKTESRIDVPTGSKTLRPGKVDIAGVAWAQHKGIEAVEVRLNKGPWQQAKLAAVPDLDTWRQWVLGWHATPGQHLIEARATDKTGHTQTAAEAPPPPNGASGYPSVQVTVSS